jgi:hypothetical protein
MNDQEPLAAAGAAGSLQLDRAEYAENAPERCAACGQALGGSYYEVGGRVCCPSCQERLVAAREGRPGPAGFLLAAAAGLGAAAVGSAIYFAVRAATGYNFGLISILVGFLVGKAVHWGCRGRGGWPYQALAVLLTYLAIVSTYVPWIVEAAKQQQTAVPPLQMLLVAAEVPFMGGVGILGWIIIAIGLYEAWKLNLRPPLTVTGPHALAPQAWRR